MKKFSTVRSLCLLTGILFLIAGCGAGKTMILKAPETATKVSSISIAEGKSTAKVPDDIKSSFVQKLDTLLYEEGAFKKGAELKLEYRFVQFNPGNQFTRYMSSGIGNAGEGTITIEVKYFDKSNNELCTIHSEGKIGSGVFGGSFDLALTKAAEEIAEYTKQNFK